MKNITSNRTLTILYGSQTGTAQDIAERIWREAKCRNFQAPVLPMDEYHVPNLIDESLVVFVCSTTGQGDQPDNMKKFWKFILRKNLPTNSLQNMKCAVLGLGDSSYVKFNYCAKKLYRRIIQLGAQSILEPGYADEQHDLGIDAVVHPWLSKLWEILPQYAPDMKVVRENEAILYEPRWMITVSENEVTSAVEHLQNVELSQSNASRVTCIANERVTSSDHFQDTRLIKFLATDLHYNPGDVLMIKPKNKPKAVKQFFDLFVDRRNEINENTVVLVSEKFPDMPVPLALQKLSTLGLLVENYWDLNMVPRRYTFELLSHFTDSELEREKLIEFTTPAGQEELYNYCNRPKRTILEVLVDFPHATSKIPLEYFFELFQPIRSRAFSITSSPKVHGNEIHILVAVVKYKTNLKLPRTGLCSSWLATLTCNDEVIIQIRNGSFTFPKDKNIPVIMIGPGTGIAPFRSFSLERSVEDDSVKNYVVFGCRNENTDFYFRDEWITLKNKGKIELFTAFSRKQENKVYVQHLIEQNHELFANLIVKQSASIYVAGNSKNMPDSVRKAFMSSYIKFEPVTEHKCEEIFEQMELSGRYQTETWS